MKAFYEQAMAHGIYKNHPGAFGTQQKTPVRPGHLEILEVSPSSDR